MALARVKRACAQVNAELGLLDATTAAAIAQAAGELLAGEHADAVPAVGLADRLGTQTNMNMNEVLANRASELLAAAAARAARAPERSREPGQSPTTSSRPRCTWRPPAA